MKTQWLIRTVAICGLSVALAGCVVYEPAPPPAYYGGGYGGGYYAPAPGYVEYRGYDAAYPVDCPGGYWSRRPVAFDAYGRPVAWSRPRFICP